MKKLLMYTSYCWAYGLSAKGDRKTTAQSMVNVANAESELAMACVRRPDDDVVAMRASSNHSNQRRC